jgi:hypothetical protein
MKNTRATHWHMLNRAAMRLIAAVHLLAPP